MLDGTAHDGCRFLGIQRGHRKVSVISSCRTDYPGVRFVAAAEDLTSEYRFGVYDILFLPESFPYGGKVSLRLLSFPADCYRFRYGEQLLDVCDTLGHCRGPKLC